MVAYGGYSHLATADRIGGAPLKLAFCRAYVRRTHKGRPKERITHRRRGAAADRCALRDRRQYRGCDPEHRRAVRQDLSHRLVDEFFTWLAARAARVSRKSDLGKALAYMLTRQDGFRLFLDDGHVDIDHNLVQNATRRLAMNRRNALFAGHGEGGRNWARFASLFGTCKMSGVEPFAYYATSSPASQTATSPKTSMP